jgi:hypothetical protein
MNKSRFIIGDYAAVRRLIREVRRTNLATTVPGEYGMDGIPLAAREKGTSSPADIVGGATDGGCLFVLRSFRATQVRAGVRTSRLRAPTQLIASTLVHEVRSQHAR